MSRHYKEMTIDVQNVEVLIGWRSRRMKLVKLENWSVTSSPYTAPECRDIYLHGKVYNHPSIKDGEYVTTSAVCGANKRIITTRNTFYELGEPCSEYREWLRVNRPNWNPDEPITIIG
jgi:hypothetical protein